MKINIANISSEEIKKAGEIELPEIEEECIEIELETMTPKELEAYKEHKRKRNERVLNRFGQETLEQKRKRQQNELHRELLEEMRY